MTHHYIAKLEYKGDKRVDPRDADGGQDDEHDAAGAVQRAAVAIVGAEPAVKRHGIGSPQNAAEQRQDDPFFV